MRRLLLFSIFLTVTCTLLLPIEANGHNAKYRVKNGESIQSALNAASKGDTIIVEAGTYREQITISKDGITLIGHKAIILPPYNFIKNTCTDLAGPGTQAGICISGTGISTVPNPFSPTEHYVVSSSTFAPVQYVTVSGFEIRDFIGLGIVVIGGDHVHVKHNKINTVTRYGILTLASKHSDIKKNRVLSQGPVSNHFIAICMDDYNDVEISYNELSDYQIGLCVQTNQSNIHHNNVYNTCTGANIDPGVVGAKLYNNYFHDTNPTCSTDPTDGTPIRTGIFIGAAISTTIQHNGFANIKNPALSTISGTHNFSAAIFVFDFEPPQFPFTLRSTGSLIEYNGPFINDDADIVFNSTGSGNVARNNACSAKKSYPNGTIYCINP